MFLDTFYSSKLLLPGVRGLWDRQKENEINQIYICFQVFGLDQDCLLATKYPLVELGGYH